MASVTVGPSPPPPCDRLTLESIPTVDLRLLTQSELTALSLCSSHAFDLRRCDDVVIPKIDRSVFNESAGSRKQTYSRLRLAPRNNPNPNLNPPSKPPQPPVLDSERIENSRIVSVFKSLFNLENGVDVDVDASPREDEDEDELALVPVSVAYCDTVPSPVNHGGSVVIDGNMKGKSGRQPKSETTLALAGVEKTEAEELNVAEEEWRRKEEREKELVNRSGVTVDLAELAKMEDLYLEELRRRTEGKESAEELLGFMYTLEGQWGSTRKKRKIVDANVFGDALPNGWKVLIAIKKKQRRPWLFCRRYVSPNGRHFVSCKEVSSYLLSLTGPQESKEKPTVQGPDISTVDNVASKNVPEIETKVEFPALPDSSQISDHDNRQMVLHISPNHENKVVSKDVHSGEVHEASASTLKCHKCLTSFGGKDELLSHLLSCHKRKRRKSGAQVEDDVLMKDGKYECQFCNKIFPERNCYFGHVGIHVKNYIKSIGGTPGMSAKQNISEPVSIGDVSMTVLDTMGSAELNAEFVAGTPNIPANINVFERAVVASPDSKGHLENDKDDQNSFSHQMELNVEAGEFSVKLDSPVNANNNTMEVDEAADYSNVKPDDCSGSDKVLFDDNNDLCENSQEITVADCVSSEVCKSPAVLAENVEAHLFSDSKQLDLGNDGGFVIENIMENEERLSSEFDLPADNEQDRYDEEVKVDDDGLTYGSGSGDIGNVMYDEDDGEDLGSLEESSAVPHREEESYGVTMSKIELIGHKVSDFQLERGLDTSFSISSTDQQTEIAMQNKTHDFAGLVNETEVDLCTLESIDVTIDTDRNTQERCSESDVLCFPKDYVSDYIGDRAVRGSDVGMVQPTGARGFQFEQTCSSENSTADVLNKKNEDRTSNLFFTSGSGDTQLDINAMTNNDQSHNDVFRELGAFSSFVGDKQAQVSKSLFSCLSMNEHNREVAKNDVGNVSSTTTTMHFSGLDKVESSRPNKSILDFSNMTEMNEGFLSSVQHDTIPEESSPFQLWGHQSCGLEESQSKVYGGASGVVHQKRASDNNSLNLVSLQRPSGGGNNLNEVCMKEQSYVQHSETGIFGRSNEARREGISHGITLNQAGFSQQFDSGYNFNKPCINQQSYGVQHTERGTYRSCDQGRQERAAYGDSLSLASVQQCDPRYSLNKNPSQQTGDTRYSMNKGYMDSIQGLSKLDNFGHSRDRDLMIGFGNSGGRSNQTSPTEFLWRSTEQNILPGGLVDSSSSRGQSSGSFQAFDFLSDKGGDDLYTANEKFDNMSSFEGLRSNVEPMEFSFMTTQESNTQLEQPKVLQYNTEMDPSFGSLPNMMVGHVVTTLCVWCGNEFHQDPLACEMQAGSIGYLCPSCKARMSGQFL